MYLLSRYERTTQVRPNYPNIAKQDKLGGVEVGMCCIPSSISPRLWMRVHKKALEQTMANQTNKNSKQNLCVLADEKPTSAQLKRKVFLASHFC